MTPDLQQLQEELNAAAIEWALEMTGDLPPRLYDSTPSERLLAAVRRLQEARKPEQQYVYYGTHANGWAFCSGLPSTVENMRDQFERVVGPSTLHIHPADPTTGLAGPELTTDEVKALLEGEG